jgi:hypothetical protein
MKKIFILLGIILLMILQTTALTITEIITSPEKIRTDSKFTIIAQLEGDSCSTEVRFYIDGSLVSTEDVACDRLSAESKVIDVEGDDLLCGEHELRAELFNRGIGVMNLTKDLSIGNQPNTSIDYGYSDNKILMNFSDSKTGGPIFNLHIEIYNVKKGPGTAESLSSDNKGVILFQPKEYGEYRYQIDDADYCGNSSVYYKKLIRVDGPYPENPMAGELISLAVPTGIGIKVFDSNGNLYTTGILTNFGGGVNLTINEPGNYTLSLGDINSYYWSRNISINVWGKENTTIKILPELTVRGGDVSIEVWSGGEKLNNSKLTIEEPSKQSFIYLTDGNGTLVFKPDAAGKYTVKFEDEKHTASERTFEARNTFKLDYSPKDLRVDGEISVYARDQLNNLVPGATISVEGTTYGLTGYDGKYSFRLNAPGNYNVTAAKLDFLDASMELYVISPLYIQIKNQEIEYGTQINPKVFDSQNKEIAAKIRVIKPSGAEVYINGSYIPDEVGVYELYAEADNYISSSKNFTVKPMPLELRLVLAKDKLYINTTTSDVPVGGISLTLEKADGGKEKLVTDELGSAIVAIKEGGRIRITANEGSLNPRYETITVVRNLNKQYDYTTLLIALSIIAFLALIGVALVYLTPKKEEARKVVKPYFTNDFKKRSGERSSLRTSSGLSSRKDQGKGLGKSGGQGRSSSLFSQKTEGRESGKRR